MAEGNGEQVEVSDFVEHLAELVSTVHDSVLHVSGGESGMNAALLYGACGRPFQTFDGEDLHPSPYDKTAALFHGIISAHVFTDGNKRTATISAFLLLRVMEVIDAPPNRLQVRLLGEVALEIANGGLSAGEAKTWLERIVPPK